MKISISTGCFYFLPFEKALRIIKAAGFKYVEILSYWKDKDWEVGQNVKGLSYYQIKKIVSKMGLEISAFHDSSGAIYNQDDLSVTQETIHYFNKSKKNLLVVHPPYSNNLSEDWWKDYKDFLIRQYDNLKLKYNNICIENLSPFDDYKISLDTLDKLNQFCTDNNLFVNLDFTHVIKNKIDLRNAICTLNPLIRSIHISGICQDKKVHFDKSDINVLDYIKFLNLKKLENITIETTFEKNLTEKQYVKQCKRLYTQLNKALSNDKNQVIPFSKPTFLGNELEYIKDSIKYGKISGNGKYTQKCQEWFKKHYKSKFTIITTSCTHALELAANVCGITKDDEVIMPSFTFTATANAFVNCGTKIKFIDIKPDDMNIDENLIEQAISNKTKAIVIVHYAGVSCKMDKIVNIAKKYNLYLIEDAAQAILSEYKGKKLGTFGDIGCFSFHATKNITMGEGGAFILNNNKLIDKAICISDNGIDRRDFIAGRTERYEWNSKGASYMASDLNAAFLFAQLKCANKIIRKRINIWKLYYELLLPLHNKRILTLSHISDEIKHNAHIFFIKLPNKKTTLNLLNYLRNKNIIATFHYTPLHSTIPGKEYGEMVGDDIYTTMESYKLLRLPLFYGLKKQEVHRVVKAIYEFYGETYK